MAAMVVQFGLATMPLGMFASVCGLTSATTSGTSGSIRHARRVVDDDHAGARRTARRAPSSAVASGREQRDVEAGRSRRCRVLDRRSRRRSRAACARRSGPKRSTGSRRPGTSARRARDRMTLPTCPVAPTTPNTHARPGYRAGLRTPNPAGSQAVARANASCRACTASLDVVARDHARDRGSPRWRSSRC